MSTTATKTVLPKDMESELYVISNLLQKPEKIEEIKNILQPEDFFNKDYGLIYDSILSLDLDRDENSILVKVKEELQSRGKLNNIGGTTRLFDINNACFVPSNAVGYSKKVKEKSLARKRIKNAWQIINATENNEDPDKIKSLCLAQAGEFNNISEDEDTQNQDNFLVFPNIMSGLAGDFARIYGEHMESPTHFFYVSFLTCLGSVISSRITIESEIRQQPRLYTLLLGESADDRKSTAISKTYDFFKSVVNPFNVCWGVGSAEGLQKKFEDIKKKNENIPFQEIPKLLLCFDEFKQFVSKCKIEASVLLPCVNSLFESNRYESHTKSSSIELENMHLSLLAASTIQTYERTWDASFTDIGFNNRLFLVPGHGERRFSIPHEISKTEMDLLKKGLAEILKYFREQHKLSITYAARDLYHNWYMNQENSVHTKRLDVYALRFAILLSVNSMKREIDEDTIEKVIKLIDWQLEVRRLHDPIDAESNIAKMEEKIRRALMNGPKTDRELKQSTHANRTGLWIYETSKKNLQKVKEITWINSKRKWILNNV